MTPYETVKPSKFYEQALALINQDPSKKDAALKLLNQGLDIKDPHCAYALGTWYFHGSAGLTQDQKKGVDLWIFAADAKVPNAMFDLAVCFEKGTAVKVDAKQAFLLYVGAALRGDKQSIFEVARCYHYGIGIEKSLELANVWSDAAEEAGTYQALEDE
jgi:uncharacterized protein